jgi:site-specific DNA-methyltransferase (adenine-specific)
MSDGKYAFEKSKIIQGDCLEKMKLIPDKSIEFICCDLPYGSTANKWDDALPNELLWEQYIRIIKDEGAIALFGTGLFAYKLALSNEKMYKYEIIWHKSKSGSSFTAKYRPVQKHENILIFGKGKVVYNPQLEEGEPYYRKRKANKGDKPNNHKLGVTSESETKNDGFRYPSTVQFFQQKWRRQDQVHPTQKPVPLLQWLVRSFTNEGDIVLDNTAGSGSLGLACIEENRDFILIEKEPNYYEVIKERIGKIFKNYGLDLQPLLDEQV